jgi:hypothetical protein
MLLVIGLQYYHVAKIVFAVSTRQQPRTGYESIQHGRTIEVGFLYGKKNHYFPLTFFALETSLQSPVGCPWPSEVKCEGRKCTLHGEAQSISL